MLKRMQLYVLVTCVQVKDRCDKHNETSANDFSLIKFVNQKILI
jgi:hypothetical protein